MHISRSLNVTRTRPTTNRRRMSDIIALQKSQMLVDTEEDGTLLCALEGPPDTPYTGKTWRVRIQLPKEYPFKSPSVGFVDRMFHPNVDLDSGSVCLNALNQEWTPVYNLVLIMETLLPQLLTYPNPDDPLNANAANLWEKDRRAFEEQVAHNCAAVSKR